MFETLIRNRVLSEIEKKGGLHRFQFGFRKNMSTTDPIKTVKDTVREFDTKWSALITIDVENAFNMVCHELIVREPVNRGISSYLIALISDYLTSRKICIDKGRVVDTSADVPQGSILGPTLWNVLYDGVLGLTVDAVCVGFADDLALEVAAMDEHTLMFNTNTCLAEISAWLKEHRLVLAPEKTEVLLIRAKGRGVTSHFP